MTGAAFSNLIVTYNSCAEITDLLADLRLHVPHNRTLVIDNASTDGTADLVEQEFPEVQLIRNSVNVGYARAVNQGFILLTSEYVFLLNPDIRIPLPSVFDQLGQCLAADANIAVAGPLQFKLDGGHERLNFTWSYWTPAAFRLYCSHLLRKSQPSSAPIPVTFLNAGCLFIRRSSFEAVGRFNEKYFLYGEEPDLFLKLKRFGFECRLLPSISVVHNRERSIGRLPSLKRLVFKLRGGWNIADAVVRGLAGIFWDRLTSRWHT